MPCIKCRSRAADIYISHMPGPLCRSCLVEVVEHRARKELRATGLYSSPKKVSILVDMSLNSAFALSILSRINSHMADRFARVKVKSVVEYVRSGKSVLKGNLLIIPWSLELESEFLLDSMFHRMPKTSNTLRFPRSVSNQEIRHYARIIGLKGSITKPYEPSIGKMLDALSKKHPDVRFGTLRSLIAAGLPHLEHRAHK
jgi:hypothetical protein